MQIQQRLIECVQRLTDVRFGFRYACQQRMHFRPDAIWICDLSKFAYLLEREVKFDRRKGKNFSGYDYRF